MPSPVGAGGRRVLAGGLVAFLTAGCALTAPMVGDQPSATPAVGPSAPASHSAEPTPSAPPIPTPSTPLEVASPAPSTPPPDQRTGEELDTPYTVDGIIVVSKKHPVSSRFRPRPSVSPYGLTPEADAALERLSAAARKAGLRLVVRSGYRSYSTQAGIFQRQLATYPSEELARRYNAEPGKSEHQTGLAVDLWDGVTWGIAVSRTKVGRWLWANAHRYGFILRYPPGKEKITGYAYEPWHFRYVGVQHSREFGANSTTTLEEYLRIN